jgi:hypothetical protein
LDARIAVLGWGSLIWDPRQLPVQSSWQPDGPELPIEFARVSDDGRLTLVLREGVTDVQTLWAVMSDPGLETPRQQLALREGTVPALIGSLDRSGGGCLDSIPRADPSVLARLASWLSDRHMDAVIWTGLPSNFEERTGRPLSVDAAVRYVEQLPDDVRRVAEQYVRRAPRQVRTGIRQGLERDLGWTAASV